MKTKKLLAFLVSLLVLGPTLLQSFLAPIALAEAPEPPSQQDYYVQTFIITAYYSPLPDQEHYVTGTFEGDVYVNGEGVHSADGSVVYPGMVAAPSTYAFGTKMYIPGVGIVAVHDRGGAIKSAGEKGNEYDRLDIWMGHGDEGLARALAWGKRTVDVYVYGIRDDIREEVYFEPFYAVESFLTYTFLAPLEFPRDIYFGSDGEEVKKMQEYLKNWGYLEEVSGFYGSDTAQAVFEFQMDFGIVDSPDELGAGHFGINTRRKFDELIKQGGVPEETLKLQKGRTLMSKYPDLYEDKKLFATALNRGDKGETVRMLQDELRLLGFLRIESTGFFGEVTEHALFKFQQSLGLVSIKEDPGAGTLGPATRQALNSILERRYEMKSMMAYEREEVSEGRHVVSLPGDTLVSLKEEE